jgi:hypothetical protein
VNLQLRNTIENKQGMSKSMRPQKIPAEQALIPLKISNELINTNE